MGCGTAPLSAPLSNWQALWCNEHLPARLLAMMPDPTWCRVSCDVPHHAFHPLTWLQADAKGGSEVPAGLSFLRSMISYKLKPPQGEWCPGARLSTAQRSARLWPSSLLCPNNRGSTQPGRS